jgi:ATPase family associated with various cellular activities (AAA)
MKGNGRAGTRPYRLTPMEPYTDTIEHLREEISRLDLLLKRAVIIAREASSGAGPDEFRGLVVTENEIDDILRTTDLMGEPWKRVGAKEAELTPIDKELEKKRKQTDARVKASRGKKVQLGLLNLAAQFDLSQAEVDILLVALAPELEPRYETLYSYLQNDVTRKHPSVNLALNLICRSEREKLKARGIFSPESPLLYHCILELADESQDRQPSLLRKFLKIDETIVRFLLDQPPKTASTGVLVTPAEEVCGLELDHSTNERLEHLATHLAQRKENPPIIRLIGQSDSALRSAAEAFCLVLRRKMVLVELAQIADEARLAKLLRDAKLWQAVLVVQSGEIANEADGRHFRQAEEFLWGRLRDFKQPVLLLGPPATFLQVPRDVTLWRIEVDTPDFDARRAAWNALVGKYASESEISRLADTFQFGPLRIQQTVNLATGLAALRDPANLQPTTGDLLDAGRALTAPQVGGLVVQIKPRYTWDDIVLPPEKLRQLRSIAAWVRFRRQVHEDWGFGHKLSRGKGLTVLFTGPSGTGKTMAAEILAHELSLDLLQIDLSSVVSKYIGETEKNLSAIFREAEQSQALLFFDEADSLFGKRTEVKDAHDRYANIEVNYLLQRVEQYEGVVVLATNLQRNIDDAFLRRIKEVVDFPFPDDKLRARIWRGHFPSEAPKADDIDFDFLASQFKLTGGNIKNIVLNAAFLAAEEGRSIKMSDLILGTKSELRKEGKLCTKSDFGPYYEFVQKEGSS